MSYPHNSLAASAAKAVIFYIVQTVQIVRTVQIVIWVTLIADVAAIIIAASVWSAVRIWIVQTAAYAFAISLPV